MIRIAVGLTFAAHGFNKFFGGGRIPGTGRWFDSIGMRPGRMQALLAASTEVVAGLLLAAGLLTSFAAAGVVAVMLVAACTVHRDGGFFVNGNGWEYNMILAAMAVGVAITGPGGLSVDHLLGSAPLFDSWWGLVIGLGGGLLAGIGLLLAFYRPTTPALA
ncbi:DoxX family protein [Gordonia alkanivorans]|nr:DoxX family protein [Gordonia alkanivorans]MDH3046769.1 DoxX family protein [Gordonia alkanivorans]